MVKAKKPGQTKSDSTGLVTISNGARRQDLETRDLEALRDEIAQLDALDVEDRVTRTALRNLRIADTQLRDLLDRIKDGHIDDETFRALPDHLKKQILTRLENNVARMRRALATAGKDDYKSPSFKCIEDYERCRARSPGSPIWCHIAMTVCQIRALATFARAMTGRKKGESK